MTHPSSPNRHAEWPVWRSISYSLLREHGIPSSYTRLIGCDRHGHITVLQSVVSLLATHVQAVGGPSTPMGGSYLRIKQPPRTTSSRVRSPGGIILRSETPGGRLTPGGYFLRDRPCNGGSYMYISTAGSFTSSCASPCMLPQYSQR